MLPNQVKVGAINYRIREKKNVKIAGDKDYLGKCDSNKSEIQVKRGLEETRRDRVLIHELVHAIFDEAGYGYEYEGSPHTEEVVIRFSSVLHQVLTDNPELLHHLLKEPVEVELGGCIPNTSIWTPEAIERLNERFGAPTPHKDPEWAPDLPLDELESVHGNLEDAKATLEARKTPKAKEIRGLKPTHIAIEEE